MVYVSTSLLPSHQLVEVMGAVLVGIGSTIMGVALMIGMLVTPYAEAAFGQLAQRSACCDSAFMR